MNHSFFLNKSNNQNDNNFTDILDFQKVMIISGLILRFNLFLLLATIGKFKIKHIFKHYIKEIFCLLIIMYD